MNKLLPHPKHPMCDACVNEHYIFCYKEKCRLTQVYDFDMNQLKKTTKADIKKIKENEKIIDLAVKAVAHYDNHNHFEIGKDMLRLFSVIRKFNKSRIKK